jgi:MoaA/NifB/PqqE/SkfB family radical SAM enzyme
VSAPLGGKGDYSASNILADRIISEIEHPGHNISAISFTGGESPLAADAFRKLGNKAVSQGIYCALITSGYWATSIEKARKFLNDYGFLKHVTLSIDRFHLEYLPIRIPLTAIEACQEKGIKVSVRLTRHRDDVESDALQEKLKSLVDCDIEVQHIVGGGRAEDNLSNGFIPFDEQVLSQCFTTGPHIDFDGALLPCCSNIIHVSSDHLLKLGNIFDIPVGDIVKTYNSNRLLKVIKVFGWDLVSSESGAQTANGINMACHGGCRQCEAAMRDSLALERIETWLSSERSADVARYVDDWVEGHRHILDVTA